MKDHHLKAWLTTWDEKPHPRRACSLFIVQWIVFLAFAGLSGPKLAAQNARVEPQTQETRNCDALRMPTLIVAGRFDRILFPRSEGQFKTYAPRHGSSCSRKVAIFRSSRSRKNSRESFTEFLHK
jgi:hypothetical protein